MTFRVLLPPLLMVAFPANALRADGKDRTAGDQKRIQGTWECISTFKDGKPVQMYVGVRAVMQGKRLTWIFPQADGTTQTARGFFKLDPTKKPKHFDWYLEGKPKEIHRRLYTLKCDRLRWSTNLGKGPRPKTFDAGRWQFVMRRVKSKE
jgi:uncharacterized protein (TIGR03067 family)